jgi:hypothetical protein
MSNIDKRLDKEEKTASQNCSEGYPGSVGTGVEAFTKYS